MISTFLYLCILQHFFLFSEGDWIVGPDRLAEDRSTEFSSTKNKYHCPAVKCLSTFPANFPMHVHFTVGTNHPSFYPLTVLRLCDLFQHCVDRLKVLITIHTDPISSNKRMANKFIRLFQDLHVQYQVFFLVFVNNSVLH